MTSTAHKIWPISIIIPTRNEAGALKSTLERGLQGNVQEVIVVDGDSTDETPAIARQLGVRVINSPPGRAGQMNAGAAVAQGDILLFLHADTLLPPDFASQISTTLARPGIAAGAFALAINLPGPGYRLLEKAIYFRSTFLQMPYGDQAIFLNRDQFHQLGGYPEKPILEDVLLVKHLRQAGRIGISPAAVLTSGRRWQRLGLIRTTLINQAIRLGHLLGVSPQLLQRWYRGAQKA
jgi:rSAM/selenodomain-associated transferase 2